MSKFVDFITMAPIDSLKKMVVNDKRVIIPNKIDGDELYDMCKDTINQTPLSPEKALYIFLKSQTQ